MRDFRLALVILAVFVVPLLGMPWVIEGAELYFNFVRKTTQEWRR